VSASLLLASITVALVLQVGVAMVLVSWRRRRAAESQPAAPRVAPPAPGAWNGWRELRVVRRQYEDRAQTLCSFHLEPVDGVPLPPFVPGQFLTFAIPISAGRTLTRCYSLSDGPNPRSYRITVKRVLAPGGRPELPPGACSSQLHDGLQVGDVVKAKAPSGRFVVEPDSRVPTVLVAGGIGITPLLSMLRGGLAAQGPRGVYLFYGARTGAERGFVKELEELARLHPTFHLAFVCSQPELSDVAGQDFQHSGHVTVDLLRRTLPAGRHRFYVCGPPPMMASLIPALLEWGVLPEDLRREAFGAASVQADPTSARAGLPSSTSPVEVVFREAGRTLTWDGEDANLLDFAERHDLAIASGCRSGSCGSCEVRLLAGTVRYAQTPDHPITPGHCLLCVGSPEGRLELEA
jgi:uncharacterized protein